MHTRNFRKKWTDNGRDIDANGDTKDEGKNDDREWQMNEEKGERKWIKYMDHREKYFERNLFIYMYIFDVLFHFDARIY